MECAVGEGVKTGLKEVEKTGQTDDEAVDFTKGGESEYLGRVITVAYDQSIVAGDATLGGGRGMEDG